MMDLVSALSTNKPLLTRKLTDEDEWYRLGCDASVLIHALQNGDTSSLVDRGALSEARRNRERLSDLATDPDWRKERLIAAMVRADPRCVYVARGRKNMADHKRPYSNGGTEVLLGKFSLVSDKTDVEAVVAVDTHAIGLGKRDTKVFISCASPIRYRQMFELGLGRSRPSHTSIEKGVLTATVEQVYAKRVIGERTQVPTGELAKSALLKHILKGGKFTKTVKQLRAHLLRVQLAHGLKLGPAPAPTLEDWLTARIDDIGFESGDDFALISPKDFLPTPLSYEISATLDSEYPLEVNVGDCVYAVEYDLEKRQVILKSKKGGRTEPPPRSWLPKFRGFKLFVEAGRRLHMLR